MGILRRIVHNAIDNEMNPNLNNPNYNNGYGNNVVYTAAAPYGYGGPAYLGRPCYDRYDRRMARREYRDMRRDMRDMRRGYVVSPPLVAVNTVPPMQQQQPPQMMYNNNPNMQYAPPQGPPPQQGPPMYSRDMSPNNGPSNNGGNGNGNNYDMNIPQSVNRNGSSPQPRGFFDEESDVHAPPPPYASNGRNQQPKSEKN